MRRIVLLALVFCQGAHADIYRWVDPQTGSVKFSNLPPPERPNVAVEVLRYPAGQPVPAITPAPAVAPEPAAAPVRPERSPMAPLEARWRLTLERLVEALERPDADGSDPRVQALVKSVEAANVELDKVDPAGVAARRRELQGILQRIRSMEPAR
jgi:hypothetical protein